MPGFLVYLFTSDFVLKAFKRILIPLFLLAFSIDGIAQDANTVLQSGGDLDVLYRNESNVCVLAHSQGFGFNYRRIRHLTGTKKAVLEIEAVNMRHPKEVKISNQFFENSKGFYYGKLNNLQIVRPGVGYQKVLFRRAERRSVEIRMGTFVGASLGFAKPIYLEILHETSFPGEFIVNQEKYDPAQHFPDNIYGRAPYLKGFDETKLYPGGYAKLALSFEYADYHNDVKAIETGIIVDAYPKVIPMMAFNKNQQVMLTFYLSLVYGKKWF